jgi:hypothetical protein
VDQEILVKDNFKRNKEDLLVVETWLQSLARRFKRVNPYTKVGCPICDAIIVLRCTLIFGEENHNTSMKAFF